MVNVFAGSKKKDPALDQSKTEEKENSTEPKISDQPAEIILKLKTEEAQLADEKRNLLQLKEQLQKKIKDQVENTRTSVQKLKAEVDELKAECAMLSESLQGEVLTQ